MYVNVFQYELPENPDNPKTTTVDILIGTNRYCFQADLFERNQRLLLPPDALQILVDLLLDNASFFISVGSYHAEITSVHFFDSYQKLIAIPV